MLDFDYDVVIVGSGPAGVSTWLHLQRSAPEVAARTLVLEKARHPRPKLCGGGIMRAADIELKRLRLRLDVPSIPIHNVEFTYHDRCAYWRQKNYFRVVRRSEFDAALVNAARQRGMQLAEEEAFKAYRPVSGGLEIETENRAYRTRVLVGADGANSQVRSQMGMRCQGRVSRLIEILTPADASVDRQFVDNTATFDFTGLDGGLQGYFWDFPCWKNGQAAMNRGVFDSRFFPHRPRARLKHIFRAGLEARGAYDPEQPWDGHPEWWFDPHRSYAQPHLLLAGDAAGVDPFGGEGISFALQYGDVAAAELVQALNRNDFRFEYYSQHIMAHELGQGLRLRRRLAWFGYLGWPRVVWQVFFFVMSNLWR